MTFWKWSKTAAANATADGTVNWAEGMAPSAVNDSARAMMAAAAKYRDDNAGATVTGGTGAAYTLATNQAFDSLANMHGHRVAFIMNLTNTGPCTLNADGLGAKPLRTAVGADLGPGVLIANTPYAATYFNNTGEWILHGFFGNPYYIPLGGMLDYTGSTAPNSAFVLPYGQAISRTTYASYFALVGSTFGPGDGSSTFNVPDLRGRFVAGKDDMGGSAANRVTLAGSGISGTVLNGTGGAESRAITQANLPPVNFTVVIPAGQGLHTHEIPDINARNSTGTGNADAVLKPDTINQALDAASIFANGGNVIASILPQMTGTASSGGSGASLSSLPPTIVLNKIVRIL